MEADGQGKIISSPRLVTADQTKALIEQGTEYPYSVTAPNGATTIAFKKAVLKLEVTPQITPEDRKSTRLNSSHLVISYAVFCLKKKNTKIDHNRIYFRSRQC